jgi:hypothetical protein
MKRLTAAVCLFWVFCFSFSAFAAIEIGPGGKGVLIITDPNATDPDQLIVMVDLEKEPVPPIPDGAILEIFDGEFTVIVTGTDTVDVTILDHEMTLTGGQSVNIFSSGNEGVVTPETGDITIIDPIGDEVPVRLGERFPIKLIETDDDEETAAGEPLGLPMSDTAPPIDTRSMEASPNQ